MKKRIIAPVICLCCCLILISAAMAESGQALAGLPVLSTSAGQSTGTVILHAIADKIGLKYDYCDVPTAEQYKEGVGLKGFQVGEGHHLTLGSGEAEGTPYKTIIFNIGASLKGMGASGLSIDSEVERVLSVIDEAKKQGATVIALHIEGKSRRGKAGSDNERLIDAVMPQADYIISTKDGNFDSRFDKIAEKTGAKLFVIEKSADLSQVLSELFGTAK